MKVKPLDDRVLVKPMESEERTEGGIVLPDTAKEKPVKGTIEAVGGGKLLKTGTRQPLSVKVGDRVIYGKYAGHEIKIGGVEFKIMKEDDILARIEE